MSIKTSLDQCEAQIVHCQDIQKQWFGNFRLSGSQKNDLQKAVDNAFNAMKKDLSKCKPETLKRYSVVWKQAKDIVESTSILARILLWISGNANIQFKSKNALEINTLISRKLSNTLDFRGIEKAELLLTNLQLTAELLFESNVSMDQVKSSFVDFQKHYNALKKNRASSSCVTRKYYAERYQVLDKGITEIDAKFKLLNKCININILPNLGVKYEDLLFTEHHYYERMMHYGIKFRDAHNPTFNLVDKKSLSELVNAKGSDQALIRELSKVYRKHKDEGLIELRRVHEDGLYTRKPLKEMSEQEFISLAMAQDVDDPAKNNVGNIKVVVIDKKVTIPKLKKMKVLGDFQSQQTISNYFKPTGNYAKDKTEALKLYKKMKKELSTLTVRNPAPSSRVKKLMQAILPKKLMFFAEAALPHLSKAAKEAAKKFKPTSSYYVPILSQEQFLALVLPGDGIPAPLSRMSVENFDKPRTLLYGGMDFCQDGFIKQEQITTGELMPHAINLKPQKNFTVEVYVKHDGSIPGILDNVHPAICARTPSGEEYSFGFSAQGNFGLENLGLKKGDMNFFDKAIFYNKNSSKAVFELPNAEAFNKFIKWAEKQKQITPAYHPLYQNCAAYANEAVHFITKHCAAKKLKRCTNNWCTIGTQKIKQFGLKKLVDWSQMFGPLRKIVNIRDGFAIDPDNKQGATMLTIDQIVGKGESLTPFMPADFIAQN